MSSSQRNELYCVAPPSDRIACRVQRSDAKYRWNAPFNVSPLVEGPMTRTFAALSTLLLAVASVAWAYPSGISGQTTAGCTCHSTSPSSATSLSLSGPTTVNPGSTSTFTLTLQNSSRPSAGFDLAIVNSNGQNAGTLGTISGQLTQIMSGELTHTQPKSLSGGSVSWQFTWQAPSTPGPYTVRAVGMAVNGNGNNDPNDQWNFLQSVTVIV